MKTREQIEQKLSLTKRATQALDDARAWEYGHPLGRRYAQLCELETALGWVLEIYAWPQYLTPTAIEREIEKHKAEQAGGKA